MDGWWFLLIWSLYHQSVLNHSKLEEFHIFLSFLFFLIFHKVAIAVWTNFLLYLSFLKSIILYNCKLRIHIYTWVLYFLVNNFILFIYCRISNIPFFTFPMSYMNKPKMLYRNFIWVWLSKLLKYFNVGFFKSTSSLTFESNVTSKSWGASWSTLNVFNSSYSKLW